MKRCFAWTLLLFLSVLAASAVTVSGEEDTASGDDPLARYRVPLDLGPESDTLELSLEDAINLAIRNNLGVEGYRYGLLAQRESVIEKDAAFDHVFFASIPFTRKKTISSSSGTDTYSSNFSYSFGFRKRFRTGTFYSAEITDDYTKLNMPSPGNRATFMLTLAHPLQKGFGRTINTAPLEIERHKLEMARLDVSDQLNSLIYDITSAYWNLALARDKLEVTRQARQLAIELYQTTENLVESGTETRLALLRAESGVASSQDGVHLAQLAERSAQAGLKALLNLNRDGSIPDTRIELSDKPARSIIDCEFDECTNFALTRRPDLRKARIGLALNKIAMDVASNQLKPKVDLSAAVALTGMAYDYGDHWEGLEGETTTPFPSAFNIEWPLGNRAAIAGLRRAEHEFNRTKTQVLAGEQGVILQIRNAIRKVRTNYRRIASAQIAAELAERSLREEEARYRVGRSTPIEVLRFQTDLTNAQNTLLQAVIDYNLAIAELNKARSSNLLMNRIELETVLEPTLELPEWDREDSTIPLMKYPANPETEQR
ncbi:MAG: TolC family protein [Planctomycetota bacterium]|nr:TolC family protein [Planctomycetota bacterium]